MCRLLVTGATGYIGSNFVRRYSDSYELYCLVRKNSDTQILNDTKCKVVSYNGLDEIYDILTDIKPYIVVHFAGVFLADHNRDTVQGMLACNIDYSLIVTDAAVNAGCKRIINTGSYWQNYQNKTYSPVNLYAATKQAFEDILVYYAEAEGMSAITLVLFDTYGPADHRKKILNIINNLGAGESLDVSDGTQKMFFCYIDDVVDAFNAAIRRAKELPDGTLEKFSIKPNHAVELKEMIEELLAQKDEEVFLKWGMRPHRKREILSPGEIYETLPGWSEKYDTKTGIGKMLER